MKSASPLFKAGERLGRYTIVEPIARGGMGVVYLAQDYSLERRVAIKCLSKKLTDDEHFVQRFRREARATAAISHNNVVAIHELGEEEGLHFFVMEYFSGETLADLIKSTGRLRPSRVLKIIRQGAKGLKAAADQRLIHRDVKPSNILIDSKDRVKLTDFGLVRALESSKIITHSDVIMGTPHYVSPEQARGEKLIDHRSDMYSLGVSAYHALSGELPFDAATPMGVMLRHVNDPLPRLSEVCPDLPPVVTNLIHRMLEKDPNNRHQSYSELIEAIEAAMSLSSDNELHISGKKSFKEHFHPTLPLSTPNKKKREGEDLVSTRKKDLSQGTDPKSKLKGVFSIAWRVYLHPKESYKTLSKCKLRWREAIVIGAVMMVIGALFIPLTHSAQDEASQAALIYWWYCFYFIFLLSDFLFVWPLYYSLCPKDGENPPSLCATHLILLSWTAQVWFCAGKIMILAFPTPWIAYQGLKRILELRGGRLIFAWLSCLFLFSLGLITAFLLAQPLLTLLKQ